MVTGRPTLRYQAVIAVLSLLMVSALLSSLNGFWKLGAPQSTLLLMSAAAAGFGWLWWRQPWIAVAVFLVGGAAAVGAMTLGYLPSWMAWVQQVVQEIYEFGDNWRVNQLESSFGAALGLVFLAATGLLAGLTVVPESLSRGTTFWSIAIGTFIFGVEWAWYYDNAALQFSGYAVLAFLIWTLSQAAVRDARWEKSGRKVGYKSHIVTPVIWVLVVSIAATIMPSTFEPLDMGAWGEKAQEAFPVLKRLRGAGVGAGGSRFSLRMTGFSPNIGSLGGPVRLDNSVAMYLTVDQPLAETTYLRGATFRVYDGRTWEPGAPEEVKVPEDGTLPTYWGTDVIRDYLKVSLRPALNMGNTIFSTWEPMLVEGLKTGYKADADGNLWAGKTIAKGTTYQVSSRFPRYSAEQIRKIGSGEPEESLKPYLQLPPAMPERVAQLTALITEGMETPYDKAVAIEQYLRRLPYELNVPATPQGRDFVDYFLFDLKKGYCVYSATAMSVMLRQAGIPSRLVEGFALPLSAQRTEGADGKLTYAVINSQAHAWVEAYFPGYGWVTFDPTPRSDLPLIDRSTPAPVEPELSGDNSAGTQTPGRRAEVDPGTGFEEFLDEPSGGAGGSAAARVTRQWPWIAGVLGLLGVLFYLAWRRLQAQERIVAREDRAVVQEAWTKTGSLMRQFDAGPQPYHTPREYAEVLGKRWPFLKDPAGEVAQEYTEARYAPPDRPLSKEAPEHARALWERIHEFLFDRYGWRAYLWKRLRWKYRD